MNRFIEYHGQMFMQTIDGHLIPLDGGNHVKDMLVPVQCKHCSQIYDLCDGKVVHRYTDCTLFRSPCCNALVDDRGEKDFTRLEKINL